MFCCERAFLPEITPIAYLKPDCLILIVYFFFFSSILNNNLIVMCMAWYTLLLYIGTKYFRLFLFLTLFFAIFMKILPKATDCKTNNLPPLMFVFMFILLLFKNECYTFCFVHERKKHVYKWNMKTKILAYRTGCW